MKHQQYIIVEHRQPEMVKALRREIFDLKTQIAKLKKDLRVMETKYGGALYLNLELVDAMRNYDVPSHVLRSLERRVNRYYADL